MSPIDAMTQLKSAVAASCFAADAARWRSAGGIGAKLGVHVELGVREEVAVWFDDPTSASA